MKAQLVIDERFEIDEKSYAEYVVWHLPAALAGSTHPYKYRLAFVVEGTCVLRYDNEVGKGDHKHLGRTETNYEFLDLNRLQTDFWTDVEQWRQRWKKS